MDDSSLEISVDLDSAMIELEFPAETIEQLLERATLMIANGRSKIVPAPAPPVQTLVVPASSEAAIENVVEISSSNEDDDVIFVGEERSRNFESSVINLCSPDKGPVSPRLVLDTYGSRRNKESTVVTKPVPYVEKESDPKENTVMCAVCMESSVGRHPHSTHCGHIFCGMCIKEAIKRNRKCPLCNKSLTTKNIFPVFI